MNRDMDREVMSTKNEIKNEIMVDNTLDIRGLFCTLWRGKTWVVGAAVLFVLVALGVSYLMKQQWSTTAITGRPPMSTLSGFYAEQQFLRNVEQRINTATSNDQPAIADDVYKEFTMQLGSYDTRRDFWLQSHYYKQRQEGKARADAVLLEELINNILFTPRDDKKILNDNVKLTAETSDDANQLLRQYIAFANQRAVTHLNRELKGTWTARTQTLNAQVTRQAAVAMAIYQRQLVVLQQALKQAEKQKNSRVRIPTPTEQLPDSDLFLLGAPILQARLESLQASGPKYDLDYDQNNVLLGILGKGPTSDSHFQTFRYLRTPEEPVTRDSPRRVFMLIMWGAIGALVGAGVALVRRPRREA